MKNSELLKTETKSLHDKTEEIMGADKIFGKHYDIEEYKTLLTKMYKPYTSIEKALRNYTDPGVQQLIDDTYKEKSVYLKSDLEKLGVTDYASHADFELRSKHEALGALYVLKGSDMGADIINKRLARVSEDWETKAFDFYSSEPEAKQTWASFKEVLDNEPTDEVQQKELLSGAEKAFLAFQ